MSIERAGRPPSMMDVAAAAGVSHQTVSRVLNGSDKVTAQTRQRVQQAIDELGYRRNSVARALVTRRSGIIGIITTTSVHHGPSSILLAIQLAAREAGYFTGVAPLEVSTPETLRRAVDHFLGQAVEGIVIVAPLVEMAENVDLLDVPVPVVAVRSPMVAQAAGVLSVSVDQEGGARQAVHHLIELGHTDIAHVPGPPDWSEAQARESEWRRVMSEAGLPVREPVARGWNSQTGYDMGLQFVREGVPTAVFAANDELAFGLVRAFHETGLSVPGDVSIVGFDDIPTAKFFIPSLTTVRQDFHELGHQVVTTLIDAIRGDQPLNPISLPTQLIVRESTAALTD